MSKWLSRAFAVVGTALLVAYHVLDEAGAPKGVRRLVGIAFLGVVALWTVGIIVGALAARRPGPRQSDDSDPGPTP